MKIVIAAAAIAVVLTGCTQEIRQEQQDVVKPVNCATAEGDLRVLESEKAHVAEEMVQGVLMFVPASLAYGVATDTEEARLEIAGGEYNKKIDAKIAEIKAACGVEQEPLD